MNNHNQQNNVGNFNNMINYNNRQIQSGIYECYANIDGFIFNKYKQALNQINNQASLIKIILFLEFLERTGVVIFLYFTNFLLFCVMMSIYTIQTLFGIYQNQAFYSGFKVFRLKHTNRITYFILNLILTIIQLDFILFFNFCKEETQNQSTKYQNKTNKIRTLYNNLISWHSQKKFFIIIKIYILLTYVTIQQLIDGDISDNSMMFIRFMVVQFIAYIVLHSIYLQNYVFEKKQNAFEQIITFFETFVQLIQTFCYFIILFYNITLLITVFSIFFASFIFRFQQGFYDPFYVDFIQLAFMGQKLTYIATLKNSDVNQQEMLFHNLFNLFQILIYFIFVIFAQIIVLYLQVDYFPNWLILLQYILTSFTILMFVIKSYLIQKCFLQNKSYVVYHPSRLNEINLKRKNKLVLDIKYILCEKNYEQTKDLINLDTQSLYVRFQSQFTIQIFLGYSLLTIDYLESECLKEAYLTLLSKSNTINIKYEPSPDYFPNKKTISILFQMLKQTRIEDQLKIDIENSELMTFFKHEKFYQELKKCLRTYNYIKILLNSLAFKKQVSQYQYLNSTLILYDLYDN